MGNSFGTAAVFGVDEDELPDDSRDMSYSMKERFRKRQDDDHRHNVRRSKSNPMYNGGIGTTKQNPMFHDSGYVDVTGAGC
jgi:hypothetical protein